MMRVARYSSPLAVLLVSIALLFSTTSAQFITNGDFDGAACGLGGTSAAPWTGGLQSIDSTLYNSFAAQSGSCATDFYSAGGPIAAAQQLAGLTIGSTYIVTFYGASVDTVPGTLATFSVSIGGSPVGAFTSTSAFLWQQFSVSFTAISTTPTLSFTANQLALIDTVTVALVATVVGDPHFQGWNGRGYDFDGEPGGVYNLLSDAYVQVNTRLDRVLATDRLYLPGVFMTEMVFKFGANHSLWIHAGDHKVEHGAVVLLDGREIQPSASQHVLSDTVGTLEAESAVRYERITPAYASSVGLPSGDRFVNVISIRLGSYYQFEVYTVENGFDDNESEWYLEFPRRFLDFSSRLLDRTRRPHGILGQTAPMRYPGRKAEEWHLEGEQEDYRIAEDNIYGDEFVYNRFSAKQ